MADHAVNRRKFLRTTGVGAVAAGLGANIIDTTRAIAQRKRLRNLQRVHFFTAYD